MKIKLTLIIQILLCLAMIGCGPTLSTNILSQVKFSNLNIDPYKNEKMLDKITTYTFSNDYVDSFLATPDEEGGHIYISTESDSKIYIPYRTFCKYTDYISVDFVKRDIDYKFAGTKDSVTSFAARHNLVKVPVIPLNFSQNSFEIFVPSPLLYIEGKLSHHSNYKGCILNNLHVSIAQPKDLATLVSFFNNGKNPFFSIKDRRALQYFIDTFGDQPFIPELKNDYVNKSKTLPELIASFKLYPEVKKTYDPQRAISMISDIESARDFSSIFNNLRDYSNVEPEFYDKIKNIGFNDETFNIYFSVFPESVLAKNEYAKYLEEQEKEKERIKEEERLAKLREMENDRLAKLREMENDRLAKLREKELKQNKKIASNIIKTIKIKVLKVGRPAKEFDGSGLPPGMMDAFLKPFRDMGMPDTIIRPALVRVSYSCSQKRESSMDIEINQIHNKKWNEWTINKDEISNEVLKKCGIPIELKVNNLTEEQEKWAEGMDALMKERVQ